LANTLSNPDPDIALCPPAAQLVNETCCPGYTNCSHPFSKLFFAVSPSATPLGLSLIKPSAVDLFPAKMQMTKQKQNAGKIAFHKIIFFL